MNRRNLLKMAAIAFPSLMTVARPGYAQAARKKISYAYLLDPAYDAVVWAINNGKVKSDLIEVEAKSLAIPQLLQSTSSKQYDVIMTAVIGLPAAASRGLELRILNTALRQSKGGLGGGIWVKKDSPLQNPKELRGKILGSYSLKSTGYTQVRIALQKKYGINTNLQGGDLKQLQIPASNLPAALSRDSIDAATLIHSQAYKAIRSGEYRTIAETARDNIEMFKMQFVSAVNVSYPEKLSAEANAGVVRDTSASFARTGLTEPVRLLGVAWPTHLRLPRTYIRHSRVPSGGASYSPHRAGAERVRFR